MQYFCWQSFLAKTFAILHRNNAVLLALAILSDATPREMILIVLVVLSLHE
jgi:hypothetical protein